VKGVRLAHETDFDGWRLAARSLRVDGVPPEEVVWAAGGAGTGLFADPYEPRPVEAGVFAVPKDFVDLAKDVVLHRDPDKWDLLYRLLWRLKDAPHLIRVVTDTDVTAARGLAKEVAQSAYRAKQYVRFRKAEDEEGEIWIAWFEPQHFTLEKSAPHFVDRYANMRWAILTPDRTAVWTPADFGTGAFETRPAAAPQADELLLRRAEEPSAGRRLEALKGEPGRLLFGPGVPKSAAPSEDALEDAWRTYFAATFNPARLKVKAMTAQMPKRYWKNLPEAVVVPDLIRQAGTRTETMIEQGPTEPNRRTARVIRQIARDGSYEDAFVPSSTDEVWAAVQACRRCDLWRNATQGVAGSGPAKAKLMFVGEQPGDVEDLKGQAFVGPAGQLLDRALAEAGVPRAEAYVTNAVKHFKWEPRGKRRLHKSPDGGEIAACKWWLDHERKIVKPKLVVALGATAGRAVFGRTVAVTKERGRPVKLPDGAIGFQTVHPSFMLRLPDEETRAREFALFVRDLRAAWALV
jgi:DNA polymerase